jgi:hypothetical protein
MSQQQTTPYPKQTYQNNKQHQIQNIHVATTNNTVSETDMPEQ